MTRTRNAGLPEGVHPHGKKFRCRIYDDSGQQRWSGVFNDPLKCHLYFCAAEQAHKSGALPPARKGDDIAVVTMSVWSLMTGAFRDALERDTRDEATTQKRQAMLSRHLEHAAWVQGPVELVTPVLLERWFDMRLSRSAPQPVPGETYDWAADLNALPEISRRQAKLLLKYVRRFFQYAHASRLTPMTQDPALMLTLRRLDRTAQAHVNRVKSLKAISSEVSRENLVAIAEFLDWLDLMPLWLCYLCGLRMSETFGLRVGDWDNEDRRLWIEVQDGAHVTAEGEILRHRPWVKTPTSMRYLYVCPTLAAALDRYIAVAHGPNPDPSTPLCVGRAGPQATQAQQTWRSQFALAITTLRLTTGIRRQGELLPLQATPHSLRKTISSVLEESGVSEAARSFYLGHKLPGSLTGSRTTAQFYSRPSDRALRGIADIIDKHVSFLGIDLLPEPTDDYMTVPEAAEQLGVSKAFVYERIKTGALTGYGNQPRPVRPPVHKRGPRRVILLLRADIDAVTQQIRPGPDVALPASHVARLLGLPLHRVLKLARAETGDELRRWDGPPASLATGDIFIDKASVERYLDQASRIAAGALVNAGEAQRILGIDNAGLRHLSESELVSEVHNNRRYFDTESLEAFSRINQPPDTIRLSTAATRTHVPVPEFLGLAGADLAHLSPADGYRWIPVAVMNRVQTAEIRRREAFRRQGRQVAQANPVITATAPPETAAWLDAAAAAEVLGVAVSTVSRRFAQLGLERRSFLGVLYVRRLDVAALQSRTLEPGWLTMRQAADRAGMSVAHMSRHIARGTFAAQRTEVGATWRTFVKEADVVAWLAARQALGDDEVLPAVEAAAYIGISVPALYRAVSDGMLPDTVHGGDGRPGRRGVHIRISDAQRFKQERTPPDGWLSVAELADRARELGLEVPTHLRWQMAHGHYPNARKYPQPIGWRVPPETVNLLARPDWADWPKLSEILTEHQLKLTSTERDRLIRALARGAVEGAVMGNRRAGWRFPPSAVPALLALVRDQKGRNAGT